MRALRLAIGTAILAAAVPTGCVSREAAAPAPASASARPVVVQGAMDIEIRSLAAALEHAGEERVKGWTFWRGTIDGYPVIVSKTLKGMSNAAAATALAAERYAPMAIINQGTAGGHEPDLHVFDIVLGDDAVNLGSFRTGFRGRGGGSRFEEWMPLDLMRSEGSAGNDPNARTMRRFHGDDGLLAAARSVRNRYRRGRIVDGVIGSSEIWNSELDRIEQFHDRFGTTAEEMETASAAQIAGLFDIPFLGIRIVSNNITNGGSYDAATGPACQEYVLDVVKAYIAGERERSTDRK
ncbi:MAG TPA: 5'-methylthioadenosine/S-adenosylhomocysteine nucleosidase [Vicinamibacterales bacterium]|nr:5'-methylthioadenosine/S-adenosylhomocysteine nucleosidase [Vicinamibacterales bacterium]